MHLKFKIDLEKEIKLSRPPVKNNTNHLTDIKDLSIKFTILFCINIIVRRKKFVLFR